MAKGKNGNGAVETVTLRNVAQVYSAATEGADIAGMFAAAHNAVAIGHRTFSNVPFDRAYKEGDTMTAGQAAFLSAQVIRASLGNDDYDSVDAAAAVTIRDIPAQYSLLEDAVDNIVIRMIERQGGNTGRRVDRETYVAKFLAAKPATKLAGVDQTVADAIATEIAALIAARKAVKGKATETAKVEMGAFFSEE
jgi:hypothetical protein